MAGLEAVSQMAQKWGGELVNVGAVGHLNPASGFGVNPDPALEIGCFRPKVEIYFGPTSSESRQGGILRR
ncbi:hypothetical protein D9M69_338060 [compost metagenome]